MRKKKRYDLGGDIESASPSPRSDSGSFQVADNSVQNAINSVSPLSGLLKGIGDKAAATAKQRDKNDIVPRDGQRDYGKNGTQ